MNQIFAGSAALLLAVIVWILGKRSRNPLSNLDLNQANFSTEANLNQISLVERGKKTNTEQGQRISSQKTDFKPPQNTHEYVALTIQLRNSINAGPKERMEAVKIAALWGHRSVLPILRRGLKDTDTQIMQIAAQAMEKHRSCHCLEQKPNQSSERPPRNVALMR